MIDSRYPNLRPLGTASVVHPADRAMLTKQARSVCARTECGVCYDAGRGQVFFYFRDPSNGVAVPADLVRLVPWQKPNLDVDQIVKFIQLGRMPMDRKLEMIERNKREDQYRRDKANEKISIEARHEGRKDVARVLRRRVSATTGGGV